MSLSVDLKASCRDRSLVELVDAIVEVVDAGRDLARLRFALEPFGGSGLFDAEVRLNGSTNGCCADYCPLGDWL